MNNQELLLIEKKVIEIAQIVGKFQMSKFRKKGLISKSKSEPIDLVTEVDLESEALIKKNLRELIPDSDFIAEESEPTNNNSACTWVIDPLDGTVNYAHGIPIFGISIALQYEAETVLGVVYMPALEELYHTTKGASSKRNRETIHVQKEFLAKKAIFSTGFPYDKSFNSDNNTAFTAQLIPHIGGIRRFGAAAYDLCMVASAQIHGYWEINLKIWDVCAAKLIVENAGGVVEEIRKNRGVSIMAGSKKALLFLDSMQVRFEHSK